jgi:hypothetical protein
MDSKIIIGEIVDLIHELIKVQKQCYKVARLPTYEAHVVPGIFPRTPTPYISRLRRLLR